MEIAAIQIIRRLQSHGYIAYFAGGCVRDRVLGATPHDYDIATSATPAQVLELYPKGNPVGSHFGVILVRGGEHNFDVATFREDGTYHDGRRPDEVCYSDPETDATRRDFTINGLFFDPLKERVIDHVGGVTDLQHRIIRAIGDPRQRFREDYLRLLRAIRFATVLDFEIEQATWSAIIECAPLVLQIAPERIREELDKIWSHPRRLAGFDLLVSSGLMAAVLPEILVLQGCDQPPQWHPEGDVFAHTRLMFSLLAPDASLPLVLSVLLHDIAKPATQTRDEDGRIRFSGHAEVGATMAESILKRFRYPNALIEEVVARVAGHMMFIDLAKMRTAKLKRLLDAPYFDDDLELHRIDCLGSNGHLETYEFVREKQREFANAPLVPPPFITGGDLIARGAAPGPLFRKILTQAQDLQLENGLASREEALTWLDQQDLGAGDA
jgi:poly(A) polymerase